MDELDSAKMAPGQLGCQELQARGLALAELVWVYCMLVKHLVGAEELD